MPVAQLFRNEQGNVAPVVALSLIGLVAAGGIAFDYARVAAMDTELQSAADQAALAAASQLDGEAGTCARAAAAASQLLANRTLFSNDAINSRAVTVGADSLCVNSGAADEPVQFFQSYDKVADTFGPVATSDADARVVRVRVDPREAFYAFTPVVSAFSSGLMRSEAIASLGSAMCKVPPVMMCNPAEPENNTNGSVDFDPAPGQGIRLVIAAPDAPGNFGFLRIDNAGAREVAQQLGYDNPPHGCIAANGVDTQPGDMQAVRAAFNTRFDISENGAMTCPGNGVCSASRNSRKDLVRSPGDACTLANGGWREVANPFLPYRARNTTPLSAANPMVLDNPNTPVANDARIWPDAIGYPRDLCHAVSVAGVCSSVNGGIVGDGAWDIDAYFQVNYNWDRSRWMSTTGLAATAADIPSVSRYDVYLWEMDNLATTIDVDRQLPATTVTSFGRPVCRPPGVTPGPTTPDRRRISVAVVNCEAENLRGAGRDISVRKWLDVFLVEPAVARGNGPDARSTNGDIYVEVIESSLSGANSTNNLSYRRDVPYLIR